MSKSREGGHVATWEREVKMIFCDLCLKEIELGNRPNTHFNKEGWTNLIKNFKDKTGRDYDRTQMKNKWDYMKKEWKLWKELKRDATGLGWDPKRRTIDASEEWWQEKIKALPNAKKFKYIGIDPELEEKLDMMFMGVVATGTHSWTPASGVEETNKQTDLQNNEQINSSDEANDPVECSYSEK